MTSKDTTIVEQHVVEEMPPVYASFESIPVVIDNRKKEAKVIVGIKKSGVTRTIEPKTDTIPDPDLQAKMKRKRIFAVTGFSSSMLGLAALFLSTSAPIIPSVLIALLLLGGVIVSALGVRSDRKVYKVLAKIGAFVPIGIILLFFLAELVVIFIESFLPVE